MNVENLRDYCLSKSDVEECFPFDQETLVFKVCGKMFCLTKLNSEHFSFNVKCNPEEAIDFRERYSSVVPGFHMNKKHWNTVFVDGTISESMLYEFIDASYFLARGKK